MPKKQRDMSHSPRVDWKDREGWQTWGDRLDFLSPENAQLNTGRLKILPSKKKK